MNRVILKGYYGFGNLGDDILMKVSSRLLKEMYPECHLSVATACHHSLYLLEFTGGMVNEVIPLTPEPKADLIVHGGGGTYFDFDNGNAFYYLLNSVLNIFGINSFRYGLDLYRRIKGWPSNNTTLRVALGVGIGSFTGSSKKYYHKMAELSNFDMIFPRDQHSFQVLKEMGIKADVSLGTDLAFLKEYWIPPALSSIEPDRKRIGFVLKSSKDNCLEVIFKVAEELEHNGYNISIFIFEKGHDSRINQRFKKFKVHNWCPDSTSLHQYLETLMQNSLLISSRAHGAIIGAALGIPAICIGVEPKLLSIAKMFPNSGSYVKLPITFEELYDRVMEGLKVNTEQVELDFKNNQEVMIKSIDKFKMVIEGRYAD